MVNGDRRGLAPADDRPTLTHKQIALVHVAKKQLQLTDGQYRAVLRQEAGVESSRELDVEGFERVMQYMAALGFRSSFTRTFYGHRPGMATPRQVGLIRELWQEYTDGKGTEASLAKWLDRTFHVSALRFLPKEAAPKAIGALRTMKKQKAARHG